MDRVRTVFGFTNNTKGPISTLVGKRLFPLVEHLQAHPLFRRCYKWFKWCYHQISGTSELVRLCARKSNDAVSQMGVEGIALLAKEAEDVDVDTDTVYYVDRSLLYSEKLKDEQRELEERTGSVEDVFSRILIKKDFPRRGDPKSPQAVTLRSCLAKISTSYRLVDMLNSRAKTPYSNTDPSHERELLELWDALMPNEKLPERMTNSWQKIGFQGKDPATDFRGMGMLGLDDLHYFAKRHPKACQRVLTSSRHDVSWYSFAIVGINITSWTINTLRTRRLQYFLYEQGATKETYHELYCSFFVHFNEYWSSKVPNITVMDFERVFKEFTKIMEEKIISRESIVLEESKVPLSVKKTK